MADTIETPLTRQKAKYEALLFERETEINELRIKVASVRGVNEMLKLQLIDLRKSLNNIQNSVAATYANVSDLLAGLPEDFG